MYKLYEIYICIVPEECDNCFDILDHRHSIIGIYVRRIYISYIGVQV